jgi:hypothetical protein
VDRKKGKGMVRTLTLRKQSHYTNTADTPLAIPSDIDIAYPEPQAMAVLHPATTLSPPATSARPYDNLMFFARADKLEETVQ